MNVGANQIERVNPVNCVQRQWHGCLPLNVVRAFGVILLSLMHVGCNGSYSSTPPDAKTASSVGVAEAPGGEAPVYTTDAKLAYMFSTDTVMYQPPSPPGKSLPAEYIIVGNPVNSYMVDPVTGVMSQIGMPGDYFPSDTKSIAAAPSNNFLYLLSGGNLVYTFSIGYLNFTSFEFSTAKLDPLNLYNALVKAGYVTGVVYTSDQVVAKLVALLEDPTLYDRLAANNPNMVLTPEILALKASTALTRGMSPGKLSYSEKRDIVNLNRLMVEKVYPNEAPKNKGVTSLHSAGSPASLPTASWSGTEIVVEPYGQFAYVIGSRLGVFSMDKATGSVIPRTTQSIGLSQLVFAPSGMFAYGSTNGALHSYSVNRTTGELTEIGTAISFKGWIVAPSPSRNMALDPTGKFLYLIGSSGTIYSPDPDSKLCIIPHQLGSIVYTYIIDATTGLLTSNGSPLETTPYIMTWGSVDPRGRFLQLLNTYLYTGKSTNPLNYGQDQGCADESNVPMSPGSIYSYYVDQSSGTLYPSGSMAAGGRDYQNGYIYAGADSISLTGDVTGRYLYLLNGADMFMYNVDQYNGALAAVGTTLAGATVMPVPGATDPAVNWPAVCYTNGVFDAAKCRVTGSRAYSFIWAGY